MRRKYRPRRPFRRALHAVLNSAAIETGTLREAFLSLPAEDRDCLPWVARRIRLDN